MVNKIEDIKYCMNCKKDNDLVVAFICGSKLRLCNGCLKHLEKLRLSGNTKDKQILDTVLRYFQIGISEGKYWNGVA